MSQPLSHRLRLGPVLAAAGALLACLPVAADPRQPILPEWQSRAQKVAEAGVPLSELAANAPESHTVQRGDTLWGISSLFLKSPWRWPDLWGMNLEQIRNPHRIYPGQRLVLVREGGRATLRAAGAAPAAGGGAESLFPSCIKASIQ